MNLPEWLRYLRPYSYGTVARLRAKNAMRHITIDNLLAERREFVKALAHAQAGRARAEHDLKLMRARLPQVDANLLDDGDPTP